MRKYKFKITRGSNFYFRGNSTTADCVYIKSESMKEAIDTFCSDISLPILSIHVGLFYLPNKSVKSKPRSVYINLEGLFNYMFVTVRRTA